MPCWQQLFPDVSVSFKLINEQQLQKKLQKTTLTLHVGPDMPHNNQETWPLSGWDVNRWPRCWPTVSLAIGNTKPGGSDWFSRTRTAGEAGWREKQGEGNSQRWRDTQTHQTDTDTHVSVRPQTQWHARTRAQAQIVSTGASTAISTNETVRSFMRSKLQTEFILLDQGWILVPGNAEL